MSLNNQGDVDVDTKTDPKDELFGLIISQLLHDGIVTMPMVFRKLQDCYLPPYRRKKE